MQFHVIKFDENSINFRRVGILSNLMEWIIHFTWNWKKKKKKKKKNSWKLTTATSASGHPSELFPELHTCRTEWRRIGGLSFSCTTITAPGHTRLWFKGILTRLERRLPWRCLSSEKKLKTGIITAMWRLFHHFNFNYDYDSNEYWRILNEACCRWSSEKKIEFKNSLKWCIVII